MVLLAKTHRAHVARNVAESRHRPVGAKVIRRGSPSNSHPRPVTMPKESPLASRGLWSPRAAMGATALVLSYPALESAQRIVQELQHDTHLCHMGLALAATVVGLNLLHDVRKQSDWPWYVHPGKALMASGIALAAVDVARNIPDAAAYTAFSDAALGILFFGAIHLVEQYVESARQNNHSLQTFVLTAPLYIACAVEDATHLGTWLLRNVA
jgi:hypothetical protein